MCCRGGREDRTLEAGVAYGEVKAGEDDKWNGVEGYERGVEGRDGAFSGEDVKDSGARVGARLCERFRGRVGES